MKGTKKTNNQTEKTGSLDARLEKGLGKERTEKIRHLVLNTGLNPDSDYNLDEYIEVQEGEVTERFKFISSMWEGEKKRYSSKIKRTNPFFAPRAYLDLEVERLEMLIGGWKKGYNRYFLPEESDMKNEKSFWQTNGFGVHGRRLLNYLIRNPITNPELVNYLQGAVKELSEREDLRKELGGCIESKGSFYDIQTFAEIENDCDRVKSFASSQDKLKRIIEILKRTESDCLKDLRESLERNLSSENLKTSLEIASRKNHQIKVIGNEEVITEYGHKVPGHLINYIFDSEKDIDIFAVPDSHCNNRSDGFGFNVYDLIWRAISKTLGKEGAKGLENIAFDGVVLGHLNGLASLTDVYKQNGVRYCFPQIKDGERNELFFKGGIHPFVIGKNPVANNVNLNTNPSIYLIAGANNGGKTTFAKMAGLLTIMSQLGAPIPAEEARIFPVSGIYTHFPKTESVADGKGRFVDELERLHNILEKAGKRDLVILDEPCAGTSNEDSYKVSLEVIRGLQAIGCPTIYTTHIHPLQSEVEKDRTAYGRCSNLYVETSGTEENPVFTHRIKEGIAGRSYGDVYARNLLPVREILKKRGINI